MAAREKRIMKAIEEQPKSKLMVHLRVTEKLTDEEASDESIRLLMSKHACTLLNTRKFTRLLAFTDKYAIAFAEVQGTGGVKEEVIDAIDDEDVMEWIDEEEYESEEDTDEDEDEDTDEPDEKRVTDDAMDLS